MSNLIGEDLKKSFRDCFDYVFEHLKGAGCTIRFRFIAKCFDKPVEEFVDYFCGFSYKDVNFSPFVVDKDIAIKIIVNNFYYDHFKLIDSFCSHGNVECHGHGDYWAIDHFIFTYFREE